ncbi:MAG: glycosyltransferase [Cellvibrionaceae bacterium]
MPSTVLQLNKIYKSNAPLINHMVKADSSECRTIACYMSGVSDGNNQMEARAAKTIYCELPKNNVKWTNPHVVKHIARIIDENQVDLVVCQFRRSIPIGVIAALLSRRKPKAIGVLHGIVGGKVGYGRKLVNYLAFKGLVKIVSVSHAGVADILEMNIGLESDKVVAIPNGLDCSPFLADSRVSRHDLFPEFLDDAFVFAMVGRLAPVKNHVAVLRAFAGIKSDFPQARLVIVGQGPSRERLENTVKELGLEGWVRFMGYRKDIPDILKNVNAYLMPSLREGFGLALAEAMVSGLPVITSRLGGMLELVPDQEHGFLVEPGSINSIAEAMVKVLQNHPHKNSSIGENARRRVLENFTADRMANDYEALYRDILAVR